MNEAMIEKMRKFLDESTPDSILRDCETFGCKVEDIDHTFEEQPLNVFDNDSTGHKFDSAGENESIYALAA